MLRFIDITSEKDLLAYQAATYKRLGVNFPLEYLQRSRVVGLVNSDGHIMGGYALVMKGPFRVIDQIPQEVVNSDPELQAKLEKSLEVTGLWLDKSVRSGYYRSLFWLSILFDVLLSGKKHYVYAYDADSKKLGEIYSVCNPSLIYKGPVRALEGMSGIAIEYVEICSLKNAITAFFTRPDFFARRFLVPRRLHLNRVFLKKAYAYSGTNSHNNSSQIEKVS